MFPVRRNPTVQMPTNQQEENTRNPVTQVATQAIGHSGIGTSNGLPARISTLSPTTSYNHQDLERDLKSWVNSSPPNERQGREEARERILEASKYPSADLNLGPFLSLTTLPEAIGQFTKLTMLFIWNNRLTTLSTAIGKLTCLRVFSLQGNRLTTLPAQISLLTNLVDLDLSNNPLTSLPMEILQLPPSCAITLTGSALSPNTLENLRRITSAEGYQGPRIIFDMARTRSRPEKPLDQLLKELFSLIEEQEVPFPNLLVNPQNRDALHRWLDRLDDIKDFGIGSIEIQKALASRIIKLLKYAETNEEFRGIFFAVIAEASATCGDRMALSVLNLDLKSQLETFDPNDLYGLADLILRGSWAMSALEEIAHYKIAQMKLVDPIEVYLAYPIKLKERLGLKISLDKMLFFTCSGLTDKDLDDAESHLKKSLNKEDARANILVGYEEWISALEKGYPSEVASIKEARQKAVAEDNPDYQAIEAEYKKQLILLTKKVLQEATFKKVRTLVDSGCLAQECFDSFLWLSAKTKNFIYSLLCKLPDDGSIPRNGNEREDGINFFLANPQLLLERVNHQGQNMSILDHVAQSIGG